MSILVWIIIGLVGLIALICMYYTGRLNALKNERKDLISLVEDKNARIKNLLDIISQ